MDGFTTNRGKTAAVSVVEGRVPLKDGTLSMDIFIDRSLVEGYFNQDKAISIRSYAAPECRNISLFSEGSGVDVLELQVYAVQSIYE